MDVCNDPHEAPPQLKFSPPYTGKLFLNLMFRICRFAAISGIESQRRDPWG